jgi:4-carboxymuconolactone decarboxylase
MARLPYAATPQSDGTLNLFRMLAHSPPTLEGFQRLGTAILTESALAPRLREAAILRVGMLAGASYEVSKHETIARWVGLTEAEIAALRPGADPGALDPALRAIAKMCDELHASARGSDETLQELRGHLGDREVVEVVATIGFYGMVCRILETLGIDIEETNAGFGPR